ncbi:hypothetical protein [Roseicyclus sp.]|uniref:hypothetical protein n=1 Tax=Roseicyclus sp. TaxID=1914329 RepID=UPI003F6D2228
MSRHLVLAMLAPFMLSGCAYFGFLNPWRAVSVDTSVARYHAAMADFSTCATDSDPAIRLAMAQRLEQSAALLMAEARPRNPDHFFMTDRVRAAARYCADSLR